MPTIDPTQFTQFSLEELRQKMDQPFSAHGVSDERRSAHEKAYWQKVQAQKPILTPQKLLTKLKASQVVQAPVLPFCDLDLAKKIVWQAIRQQSQREGFEFICNDQNRFILAELAAYFSGNSCQLDLRKGLLIYGPVGTGKSFLFRVFRYAVARMQYQFRRFSITSIPKLYNDAQEQERIQLSHLYQGQWCLDDLGFHAQEIRNWGNRLNLIEMILTRRYDAFVASGTITHITSNLPFESTERVKGLDQILDERIVSRLKQMMNIILLNGKDYRVG